MPQVSFPSEKAPAPCPGFCQSQGGEKPGGTGTDDKRGERPPHPAANGHLPLKGKAFGLKR